MSLFDDEKMAAQRVLLNLDETAAAVPMWQEALCGVEMLLLRAAPVYYGIGAPRGDGTGDERSSKDLSWTEARKVIDALDGLDRDGLIAYMAEHEVTT